MRLARFAWLLLLPVVPWAQVRIDDSLGGFRAQEEVLYLWSGEQVRRMVPGFENVMADLYWLRTVQYFGGQRVFAKEKRFELLQPLVDITTTLDPKFEIAYRYGASFLAEPNPIGAGKPEEAVALLERGVANLPRTWLLRQNLGFYTYFFLRDPRRAADSLLAARELPGAPVWLETMAADFLGKGGDRQTARQMWSRMYENQEEGPLKWNAKSQLQRLDALDAIDVLNRRLGEFKTRHGRWPASFHELKQAGLLPFQPVDPTGVPFHYDPVNGKVEIPQASTLWRRPGPLGSGLQ
jgi:hypothetical protein